MQREAHIQTETGKRMLRAVTPIYTDEYQLSVFNANGLMMEEVQGFANKLSMEVIINNATWSLPYWESLFRIKPKDNQTIGERRRAVILRMNEYFPVTRRRMESIVDTFTENGGTAINDRRGDYIFEVILKNSGSIDLIEMIAAIEDTKPAHLDYHITQESNENHIYVSALALSGEQVTIYPWAPEEIQLETRVDFGGGSLSYEELTIYPK